MKTPRFEFGVYTDITEFVKSVRPDYDSEGFVKFFICPDVNDYWFVRVLSNINKDYEHESGTFLIERDNIGKQKCEQLTGEKLLEIIQNDSGDCYDIEEYFKLENIYSDLSDVFGIIGEDGNKKMY